MTAFTRRRGRGGHAQAIGVSLIAAVPFGVASLLIRHEVAFMVLTAITVFLLSVYNGPAAAVVDELGPPRFAATLQSFAMFWIHVLGNAPAGSVVGWIADRSSVAFGLQAAVAAMGIAGVLFMIVARRQQRGDHRVTTTQQYYDRFSETYDNERHRGYHRLIDELELDLVRRYGAGKDVFEAGCGTGLLLREAATVARSAVGLDLSRGMLTPARARGLTVVQGSLTDVPLPSASFDLVYSMKVLAHVPPIERAVAELARLVRPGGHLLLEFYNPLSLRYLAKRLGGPGRIADDGTDESHVYTRFDRARSRPLLPSPGPGAGRGARRPRGDARLPRVRLAAAGQAVRVGRARGLRCAAVAKSRRLPHSCGPEIRPDPMSSLRLLLPPKGVLLPNDEQDPLHYYYHRWIGWLYRHRLQMGLKLLPAGGQRVLEVGVGSGVLVPTLTARYPEYTGTDLTLAPGLHGLVAPECKAEFLRADLLQDDLPADHYDAIVCFSVLEHIADSRAAARAPGARPRPRRNAGLRLPDGQQADVACLLDDRLQAHRRRPRQRARADHRRARGRADARRPHTPSRPPRRRAPRSTSARPGRSRSRSNVARSRRRLT